MTTVARRPRGLTLDERIDALWMPEPNTGCWIWLARVHRDNRPMMWDGRLGRKVPVRQIIFAREVHRDAPRVMMTCETRGCINPDHMTSGAAARAFVAGAFEQCIRECVARENGCLMWTGSVDKDGYGVCGRIRAHRRVFEDAHGKLARGLVVRHSCDTPGCVAIAHLLSGTNADNVADRVARGRTARGDSHYTRRVPGWVVRGERSGSAKLTARAVMDIRSASQAGVPIGSLAVAYGVHVRNIKLIIAYKSWKHVA